jgi:nucleotide-binding universal stress UspA family protein
MIREHRLEHIVAGCDGSEESRAAVALAAAIARASGATLSLVGVYPSSFFPVPGSTDRGTLRGEAKAALTSARDELAPGALTDTVSDFSVPRALRHYAARWRADLLVIGSDPAAPSGQAAVSRRGRQLLGDLQCPLALAQRGFLEQGRALDRIGVGYDGGPESQAALGLAAQLARATGARLLVRTVIDDRIPVLRHDRVGPLPDWRAMWEVERTAALARTTYATASLGVATDVSAVVGDPGKELRSLTDEVDLIVIGSRRWGPLARLLAGASGEALFAGSGCSVLVVPRPSPTRFAPDATEPETARSHS